MVGRISEIAASIELKISLDEMCSLVNKSAHGCVNTFFYQLADVRKGASKKTVFFFFVKQ